MPENLFPGPGAPKPGGDDAPCRLELRLRLLAGGVDEIGHESHDHLRGYARALFNHGLISPAEFHAATASLADQHRAALDAGARRRLAVDGDLTP